MMLRIYNQNRKESDPYTKHDWILDEEKMAEIYEGLKEEFLKNMFFNGS